MTLTINRTVDLYGGYYDFSSHCIKYLFQIKNAFKHLPGVLFFPKPCAITSTNMVLSEMDLPSIYEDCLVWKNELSKDLGYSVS